MKTPLEVIQEGEMGYYDDEYILRDTYVVQTLALLQALHDELEGKKKPVSKVQSILAKKRIDRKGTVKELSSMYPYNKAIQDQQDNLQALMDKIRV